MNAVGRLVEAIPFREGRTQGFARGRFHDLAYVDWGDPDNPHVVVCVHGLSRQGRDFDPLARALVGLDYRVVCPDLPGRGRSGWLTDPELYGLPQYVRDMATLLAHLRVERIDWVGTSLGGLVGMVLAGAENTPIRRLVINDIGPFLPWAALRAIGTRLREAPRHHHSLATAEGRLRTALASFGTLSDAEWRHLTEHSFYPEPGGGWRPHYDPNIGVPFAPGRVYNVSMWRDWEAVRCPVLLLRGTESDLLRADTARQMTEQGPRAKLVEIPGCGHAPALLDPGQIGIVTDWLGPAA